MRIKELVKPILFCFLISFLFSCSGTTSKPNIILIVADDLGYGDLGVYGQKKIKTPHIDKLAENGVKYTQFYAGSTVCAPSRCVLALGKPIYQCPIKNNIYNTGILDSDTSIGTILKNKDYNTACIGKWGIGKDNDSLSPNKHGFNYFLGFLNQVSAHNHYPAYLIENGDTIHLKNKVKYAKDGYSFPFGSATLQKIDYANDIFYDSSIAFIQKQSQSEKPFFLYLPFTIPHANNEFWLTGSRNGIEVPNQGEYVKEKWANVYKNYAASVTRLDNYIGGIVKQLKESGKYENTMIIFTSDNGPHSEGNFSPKFFESAGGLRGQKRDLYEGGIRVPFILHYGNHYDYTLENNYVYHFKDIYHSFAQLIDESYKIPSYARSIFEEQPRKSELFWEFYTRSHLKVAVRKGKFKGILFKEKGKKEVIEIYNLEIDPNEKNNLSDQEFSEKKDIVNSLKNYVGQNYSI